MTDTAIVSRLLPDGAFVAGDRVTGVTVYAYPTSPSAERAKQNPMAAAQDMLTREKEIHLGPSPYSAEYNRDNWRLLDVQHHCSMPINLARAELMLAWIESARRESPAMNPTGVITRFGGAK